MQSPKQLLALFPGQQMKRSSRSLNTHLKGHRLRTENTWHVICFTIRSTHSRRTLSVHATGFCPAEWLCCAHGPEASLGRLSFSGECGYSHTNTHTPLPMCSHLSISWHFVGIKI